MKVALAQLNTTVGDLQGNVARIVAAHDEARAAGAELVVYPELTIPGYPPLDLLDRPDFIAACSRALEGLAPRLRGPAAVVGSVRPAAPGAERGLFNSAAIIVGGEVVSFHDKVLLPTYDVFDEDRHFEPGGAVQTVEIAGTRVGVAICEDLWNPTAPPGARTPGWPELPRRYRRDVAAELRAAGAEVVVSPCASPFHDGQGTVRESVFRAQAVTLGVPVLVCNLVGGNTELIFDGTSVAVVAEGVAVRGRRFEEDLVVVDTGALHAEGAPARDDRERVEAMASALVLGLRDYFRKCGFERAVVGLSGGIDSAVTAVLACDALGAGAVRGVSMPSRYSSEGSVADAEELARRLGMELERISIEPMFEAYRRSLAAVLEDGRTSLAEENLQARIRGAVLMTVSNHLGDVVLATGNKSELGVGYCTLYGDMCGGLSPLGDVTKLDVYRIARLPRMRERIPPATLSKPPSAELRPDQRDDDSLPPYEVLDAILELYVEEHRSIREIAAAGHPRERVEEVVELVERNEYKRRQAAPALRVTTKAFGLGRRLPLAFRHGW